MLTRRLRFPATWLTVALVVAGLGTGEQAWAAKPKKPKLNTLPGPAPDPVAAPTPPPAPAPVPAPAVKAPAAPALPVERREHAVNVSPMGLAYGDYAVNYQWMPGAGHALLAELTVAYASSEDAGTTLGAGMQVGYRWLTRGHQNSWFLGLMGGYDVGSTAVMVRNTSGDLTVTRKYDLPYKRWRVTGNFGRRWVFGPGLNVTARFGLGPGHRAYARGGTPEADHQAASLEAVVNLLPVSLDTELSVGWLF